MRHAVWIRGRKASGSSHSVENLRKRYSQAFADFFDVEERDVPRTPLDAGVIRPVQSTAVGRLLLGNCLLLPNTAEGAAETNANVERHRVPFWEYAADESTSNESHCC